MSELARALRLVWRADPWAMSRGAALTVTVLLMGAALLGLSGWFVTATGLAGLAGIGIAFDVFRPSAGIRFLALGRAGARYAERLLTHDATLRALAALRADLLARALRRPWAALQQARAPQSLTRITADVDALDGVALRVALPLAAAVATQAIVAVVLGWLVGWAAAGPLLALYVFGAGAVLAHMARRTYAPSVAAERAGQALRRDSLELLRGQPDLAVQGRLVTVRDAALDRGAEADAAARRLDRMDRRAGASLSALVTVAAAAAMLIGTGLVASGGVDAARAALAVFVALALAETVLPLRRGLAEIGRIRDAAGRVLAEPGGAPPPAAPHEETTPATAGPEALALHVAGLACGRPGARAAVVSGLSFDVAPGGALALTGPSGAGKSSVLHALAGLEAPLGGTVRLGERPLTDLPEAELRAAVCLVPQRSALIGGTIRENLALARAGTADAEMQAALAACHLADRIAAMGGLDARLAEAGSGLSGGETRRLVLARALLRRPAVLLLDEPTEGLDDDTARAVLDGLRAALPRAAIVTASHRAVERDWAGRTLPVRPRAEVAPPDMQTSA